MGAVCWLSRRQISKSAELKFVKYNLKIYCLAGLPKHIHQYIARGEGISMSMRLYLPHLTIIVRSLINISNLISFFVNLG